MITDEDIIDFALDIASEEKAKEISARIDSGDEDLRDRIRFTRMFHDPHHPSGIHDRILWYILAGRIKTQMEKGKTPRSYLHDGGA